MNIETKPETFTEHDCPKCGEHFSTCICDEAQGKPETPTMDIYQQWYENARAGRDKAQAHAEKLAEALREVLCAGMTASKTVAWHKAEAVLAAYAAKQ